MQIENHGHIVLNDAPCPDQTTIAVTGMGRSGTTMVARILAALDIPMGPDVSDNFLEEDRIVRLLKAGAMGEFAGLCQERDSRYERWCFKCPTLRVRLAEVDPILRNPRYIITYRDMVAISSRNLLELGSDPTAALEAQARKQYNLMRALLALSAPVLLLSYEKAMRYPEHSVTLIAGFCGTTLDPDQAAQLAQAEIRPNDPRYLGALQ